MQISWPIGQPRESLRTAGEMWAPHLDCCGSDGCCYYCHCHCHCHCHYAHVGDLERSLPQDLGRCTRRARAVVLEARLVARHNCKVAALVVRRHVALDQEENGAAAHGEGHDDGAAGLQLLEGVEHRAQVASVRLWRRMHA